MNNSDNNGRLFYMRKYESKEDIEHNKSGKPGRARSGSMGTMDDQGNRADRFHFHALNGQHTLITTRPDAGPHSKSEQKSGVSTSSRPMIIPGSINYGVVEGVKRKY